MSNDYADRKASGLVKLALAGSALLLFMGYRSCDRRRPVYQTNPDGTRSVTSTTRPSGSGGAYYSGYRRPWYFFGGGGSSYRSSPSGPSRTSGTSTSNNSYSNTSRGGFGRSSGSIGS